MGIIKRVVATLILSAMGLLVSCTTPIKQPTAFGNTRLAASSTSRVQGPFGTHEIDVSGLSPGEPAVDPRTGGIFLVPPHGSSVAQAATEADIEAYEPPSSLVKDYEGAHARLRKRFGLPPHRRTHIFRAHIQPHAPYSRPFAGSRSLLRL